MIIYFYLSLIFFLFIAAVNLRWGVYLILTLLPAYLLRTTVFAIPTTWLELAIYGLFLIWLIKTVQQKKFIDDLKFVFKNYKKLILLLVLWFAAAILATIISPNLRLSAGALKGWWLDPMILIFLILATTKKTKHLKNFIFSLLISSSLVSVYGLIEYFGKFGMQADGLLNSFFKPANYVALLIVPIIILNIGLLPAWENKSKKTISICLLTVSLLGLFFTKSYGGFLALIAGLSVLLIFIKNIKLKKIIITIFMLTILGGTLFAWQHDNKVKKIFSGTKRNSLTTRLQIWEISSQVLKEHYLLGVGLGNFQAPYRKMAYKMYQPPLEWEVVKAHNLYLNTWLEMGLLGIISLLIMLSLTMNQIKQLLNKTLSHEQWWLLAGSSGAMIAILTHGLLDTPYFKNDLSVLFLFILIIPSLLNKQKQ